MIISISTVSDVEQDGKIGNTVLYLTEELSDEVPSAIFVLLAGMGPDFTAKASLQYESFCFNYALIDTVTR